MTYDLKTLIIYFIGAFVCCLAIFFIGKTLLDKKFKDIKKIKLLLIIPFTLLTIGNNLVFDNIVKLFGTLIIFFMIFKFIFEERVTTSFIYSIVSYIIVLLSEIIVALIVSLYDYIFSFSFGMIISKSLVGNLIISILAYIITRLLKKQILYIIPKISKKGNLLIYVQGLITIVLIVSAINYIYLDNFKFNYKIILITIIILCSIFLTFILLKQYLISRDIINKYNLLQEYMKPSIEMMENYRRINHKNKNNLIIIKGYIKENTEQAYSYISNLIENYESGKYKWFSKINLINFDSLRYLFCYKLSNAENENVNIFVSVDELVKKFNFNNLDIHQSSLISDILGEILDNAIYAASETKEKELLINVYKKNENIVFEVSNSFLGKVNLDLIFKNGYTTKGKGHGLGLYEINKVTKNCPYIIYSCEVNDNYFITKLILEIDKLK